MRPTLKEQLRVFNIANEQLKKMLKPPNKIEFWIYRHSVVLWRILRWRWFNIWTGEDGFWLFAKHGFREWKE